MEQQFHSPSQKNSEPRGAQAVDRAAQLLVHVLQSEEPLAVSDLVERTELPKSTVSRLLTTLEAHGLVLQDGPRGKLQPGPVLMRFAHRGAVSRNLIELAEEALEVLSTVSGETINVAIPAALGVEHIAQVHSRHFLGTGQWVGRRLGYHTTAVGKVFLAFGAAELPDGELERLTPRTITDRQELAAELERVRRDGFATTIEELEPGLTAIAAPVHGPDGKVIAAIVISGPSMRLGPLRLIELRPILINQTRALSERLGYGNEGEQAA